MIEIWKVILCLFKHIPMPWQFCLENNPNPMYEGRGGKNTAAYISNFLLSHLRDFFLCTPALLLFNAFLSSLVFPWKAVFLLRVVFFCCSVSDFELLKLGRQEPFFYDYSCYQLCKVRFHIKPSRFSNPGLSGKLMYSDPPNLSHYSLFLAMM